MNLFSLLYYAYASFANSQLWRLKVIMLHFKKLMILERVEGRTATVGIKLPLHLLRR